VSRIERLTGLAPGHQGPILLVGLGHGGVHWIAATLYVVLPYAAKSLDWSYAEAGALVAVFHGASFLTNAVSGAAADLGGRRVEVQILALVVGAAALACFAVLGALGVAALAIAVAAMGFGNNLWHPAAISYLGGRYPQNRGYALSIHGLGASTSDALAPLVVGGLLTLWGWRTGAGVSAAVALLPAFFIFHFLLRHERRQAAAEAAANAPTDAVSGLGDYFRRFTAVLGDRAIVVLCLMAGFRTMAQNGLLVFLPLYLSHGMGLSPAAMGLALGVMQAGGVVAAPLAGVWSDRLGRRPLVIGGLGIASALILALPYLGNYALLLLGAGAMGLALFAVRPVVHGWLMDLAPPAMGGSATALMFALQGGLSVVIPWLGGLIADAHGFTPVFWLLSAAMAATVLIAAMVPRRRDLEADRA
jgi:MFS family permease